MAVTCMPRMAAALATMALLAGCATSSAQQAAPGPGPEEAHVHAEQPSIPAEQLRDGLLRLLEALHTQDMDPALVERSLGVQMGRVEGRDRVFGTYGPVDEGWNYSIDLVRRDDAEPYIDLYLFPDRLPGKRWVLTQCTLDPHAFANALRQAGWTVRDKPYWYVKAWYLHFERPILGSGGGVSGHVRFLYMGEEPDERQACMVGFRVHVGKWDLTP